MATIWSLQVAVSPLMESALRTRIAPPLKYFCSPSLTNMLVLMASVKTLSLVTTRTLCTAWL